MTAWRPLLIFLANFIAGWLLTHGYIDPSDHNGTAQAIADGLGYFILGATSIFSLVHAFKKPHELQTSTPVTTTAVITQTKVEQTKTGEVVDDLGTPPVQ